MRARLAVAVGLLLIVAARPPTAAAQASGTEVWGFSGSSAVALFRSTDGCIADEVYVIASEGLNHHPGTPAGRGSSAGVSGERRNRCTGEMLFFGSGVADGVDFAVAPRLASARLRASVPIRDLVSGSTVEVAVAIDWTGTSRLERGSGVYRYEEDGFVYQQRENGKIRWAEAAGRASDGATQFIAAGSSGIGWIAWSNYGQVTIDHSG